MLPIMVGAETKTVTVDGINYEINDTGPLVASVSINKDTSGDIVIPGSITVGNLVYSVTSIKENAFGGCENLTSVVIPNSVTSIGRFSFCSDDISFDNKYRIPVIAKRESNLKSVTIGSGIEKIGFHAFGGCKKLESVYLSDPSVLYGIRFEEFDPLIYSDYPDNYIEIGNPLIHAKRLYVNGREVDELTIPDGITEFNSIIFSGFCGLTSVNFPNGVVSIGSGVFKDCSGLVFVNMPNSVTSVGESAFEGCTCLKSITIPSGVTYICSRLFADCTELRSVTVPNTVKGIGDHAFSSCSNLSSITIPNSVTSIGVQAFYRCNSLSSVTIPNNVLTIKTGAFSECTGLSSVTFSNCVASIGAYAFSKCTNISSLDLGDNVTEIGDRAFTDCSNIKSIYIPNSVKNIGESSFSGCSQLKTVSAGKSINRIGANAFADCIELIDFTIFSEKAPYAGSGAFAHPEAITLHVLEGYVESYRRNNPWASFKSIVAMANKFSLVYMVDGEVYKSYDIKSGSTIIPETEPVKEGYTFSGWSEIPEEMPAHDVTVTGTFTRNPLGKCASPTISIINGELVFGCETDDVEYHYDIKHLDVKSGEGNNVKLGNTYRISVYASKDGYEDSDVTTRDFQFAVGKKGDVDGNGEVNAADVVQLTNIIMSEAE